ncbi:ArnT family glycosyltransferase [Butyrivibrio sp. WCD2001]|uniref:ArnT family glycosyltransferase n=1 Tax=Butyrivibrio sp. WCD2001 TaxID=1280681 RepID=UPI000418944E|nr:glycosyltransferase family 39 protein [Butyrivibrio sp. WCD2001]
MGKKVEMGLLLTVLSGATLLIVYMLFHNLGAGYLISTDEAYHATNAYEMYKQSNWIVNTYKYAADYFNSKPPLCLDMMAICYKLLGVCNFAARFPSAVGGLLTLLVVILFLIRRDNLYSAVLFPFIFAACTPFFTFHMYRAAEMDSFFNLFFVIAMISLYEIMYNPRFMYLYGISLGLAFMCKGPHAALIFMIGLLYIPRIREAFKKPSRVVISAFLAALLPVAWMVKRSMFDGMQFIDTLMFGETVDRVSTSDENFSKPIIDFIGSNVMQLFIITIIVATVAMAVIKLRSGNRSITVVTNFIKENYLLLVWTVLPVMFFAILKSYLDWYIYTSLLALCILVARLGGIVIEHLVRKNPTVAVITTGLIVAASFFFIVPCIKNDINLAGTGGHPVDEFTQDMLDFASQYGDEYAGRNVYLLSDFRQYSKQGHWECEYVAPAEMYCDFVAVDGTLDNFLSDDGSLIIVDKDLWDKYSSDLTGHVILQDNSYLIFSTDMY